MKNGVISRRKGKIPGSKSYQKCQRLGTLYLYVTFEMRASRVEVSGCGDEAQLDGRCLVEKRVT